MAARLLLLSGSLRHGSTNSLTMRTAAEIANGRGVTATVYASMAKLPHYSPDVEPPPLIVEALRSRVTDASAVLISTPEYAGALPGSFKNTLDWCVGSMAFDERRVGWINVHPNPDGAAATYRSLRRVLGYVNASIIEAACAHVAVPRDVAIVATPTGTVIADDAIRARLSVVVDALLKSWPSVTSSGC